MEKYMLRGECSPTILTLLSECLHFSLYAKSKILLGTPANWYLNFSMCFSIGGSAMIWSCTKQLKKNRKFNECTVWMFLFSVCHGNTFMYCSCTVFVTIHKLQKLLKKIAKHCCSCITALMTFSGSDTTKLYRHKEKCIVGQNNLHFKMCSSHFWTVMSDFYFYIPFSEVYRLR